MVVKPRNDGPPPRHWRRRRTLGGAPDSATTARAHRPATFATSRDPLGLHRLLFCLLAFCALGCNPLAPRRIVHDGYRVAPELLAETEPMIERGKPRPIIDSIGWLFGVPGRLLLWDPRIDNHHISRHTEAVVAGYLHDNDLHHVKVRLNQYAPLEDWHRLRNNRTVGWGYRYTLGTLSLLGEAIFAGRIFGGDHYNPFTATVHLYSDVPSIGLHEAAHAKDFARRRYPGTYALAYLIPVVPLWHERVATSDSIAYAEATGNQELLRESYRILYPAYGTYVGTAAGQLLPGYADPLYVGSVLFGHAAAHRHSYALGEPAPAELVGPQLAATAPLDRHAPLQTTTIARRLQWADVTPIELARWSE